MRRRFVTLDVFTQTRFTGNPLAVFIQQFRHAVIDPTAPSAAAAIGGTEYLLIPGAILFGTCALGLYVFNRMAPHVAEQL